MATVPISAFLHSPRQDKAPKGLVFCVCVCRRRCAFIVCFVCSLLSGSPFRRFESFSLGDSPPPFFSATLQWESVACVLLGGVLWRPVQWCMLFYCIVVQKLFFPINGMIFYPCTQKVRWRESNRLKRPARTASALMGYLEPKWLRYLFPHFCTHQDKIRSRRAWSFVCACVGGDAPLLFVLFVSFIGVSFWLD